MNITVKGNYLLSVIAKETVDIDIETIIAAETPTSVCKNGSDWG